MKKNKKNFFGQNSKSWFVYFTNQEIPQVGFFFGEKATLKESYEPSLGKLRWPAFFMTVYPTVERGKTRNMSLSKIISMQMHKILPIKRVFSKEKYTSSFFPQKLVRINFNHFRRTCTQKKEKVSLSSESGQWLY